jgi:hypothetical protein
MKGLVTGNWLVGGVDPGVIEADDRFGGMLADELMNLWPWRISPRHVATRLGHCPIANNEH